MQRQGLESTYLSICNKLNKMLKLWHTTTPLLLYRCGYSQLFILIMDEKLRQELTKKKIREMKNPTILMNENDFNVLKKDVESKTTVVVGNNPTYQGVPIKTSQTIEIGNIVVYDDVSHNWL
jgi:hypothetical protein